MCALGSSAARQLSSIGFMVSMLAVAAGRHFLAAALPSREREVRLLPSLAVAPRVRVPAPRVPPTCLHLIHATAFRLGFMTSRPNLV